MDQDRDGTVSMDDLKEVYASLGKKETKRTEDFITRANIFFQAKHQKIRN